MKRMIWYNIGTFLLLNILLATAVNAAGTDLTLHNQDNVNSVSPTLLSDSQTLILTPLDAGDPKPPAFNYIPLSSSGAVVNTTWVGDAFEGYNLFVLRSRDLGSGLVGYTMLILDMEGNVVKERFSFWPVKLVNSTTVLGRRDQNTATFWNMYDDTQKVISISGHHEVEYNFLNNTILTLDDYTVNIGGTYYLFDRIKEYDLTGQLVWSLDSRNFISHEQWCPHQDYVSGVPDVTHSNTIFFDSDEDVFYYNPRNLNTFYKIDHKTGQVLWGLGEYGNFTLIDRHGKVQDNLFYHPHSVEQVDDNTFILFDNDRHNQTNPNNMRSRIIEITLNETTKIARETWSWTPSSDYWSNGYGDADRLPNGNRLGVFGASTHIDDSMGARLAEVNEEGEIVWETNFPNIGNFLFGVYRMERFRYTPILNQPEDILAAQNEEVTAEWEAWYNFRPKRTVNGTYRLLLNDSEIKTGDVAYDKFWRPTNLTFNLGTLAPGWHNLTLEVNDGEGHSTADSLNITIEEFYIEREGPVSYEVGQGDSEILWHGATASPLFCNITVNSTLHTSQTWNGETLTLDLSSLEVGGHQVLLRLYNDTELVHTDSFWVFVYPYAIPVITPSQPEQVSITWNNTMILQWELYDASPSNWSIYLNDTLVDSDAWIFQELLLNWTLPNLDDVSYNITIVAIDLLGQRATNTTWVTVNSPSPPVIIFLTEFTEFLWGHDNASLAWEVHGGNHWSLFRNGTRVSDSDFIGLQIEFLIENWQAEGWSLGSHNVTLRVEDALGASSTCTIWIWITLVLGDPYADFFLATYSQWYLFGDNAVGEPDQNYAQIFLDYGNGYVTLDMGEGEEILDGTGVDFHVVARGGEYRVRGGNSLTVTLTTIGTGQGTQAFDLAGTGLSSARYLRIEYQDGTATELDAIVALNYNHAEEDFENPQIIGPDDFWVLETQIPIPFTWEAEDETPWYYRIEIDGELYHSGPWNGSEITFNYWAPVTGVWVTYNVTLTLEDVCGNKNQDSVLVDVLPIDNETPQIHGPEDFWVWGLQVITLTWEAYDTTPLDYSLFIDGVLVESGPWNGSDITYVLGVNDTGTLEARLFLRDFFGHQTEDIVLVEVLSFSAGFPVPIIQLSLTIFIVGTCVVLSAILIFIMKAPRTPRK